MNHPNLQDQEAALMARFRLAHANENYLNFIQDGIVNHEQYLHASPKIVFLLREPHWETKDEDTRREFSMISDLSEGVRNRKDWRNWHIIVRWASALLDGNSISWEDLRPLSLDNEFRKKQLNRVAIVNIKKSGGARSLNWATFIEYAKRHKKLVTDQIELYSPDVIVCSGTFCMIVDYLYPECKRGQYEATSNGTEWCVLPGSRCIAINLPHFGIRSRGITHQLLHNRLALAWPELDTYHKSLS